MVSAEKAASPVLCGTCGHVEAHDASAIGVCRVEGCGCDGPHVALHLCGDPLCVVPCGDPACVYVPTDDLTVAPTINEARLQMVTQLHKAVFGATWARPESPHSVWYMLLDRVRDLSSRENTDSAVTP